MRFELWILRFTNGAHGVAVTQIPVEDLSRVQIPMGTQRTVDVDNYTNMYIMVYMNTILNIKTDKALKDSAKELAAELGVPLSTAINAFLKQFVRDRELTVTASYKPSVYLRGVLAESDKEIRQGKVKGPFAGVENLVKSLNS